MRRLRRVSRARRPLVALVVLVLALVVAYLVQGTTGSGDGSPSGSPTPAASSGAPADGAVALSALPSQAAQTVRLIRSDGPFPYPRNDGVVFHNYEHVLPAERAGWYHEYTVPTPGSGSRGARRIVTGADGAFFYTGDHYETFRRVDVSR